MTRLYAQPFDLDASGFYLDNAEEYAAKAGSLRNRYGQPVEEVEIEFTGGEAIDAELFQALRIGHTDIEAFFDGVREWTLDQKVKVIIAVGEVGYVFTPGEDHPDHFDVDVYAVDSLRDLAEQIVDDGLISEIPEAIANYLDYDAIVRELSMDYGVTTIASVTYAYRSA